MASVYLLTKYQRKELFMLPRPTKKRRTTQVSPKPYFYVYSPNPTSKLLGKIDAYVGQRICVMSKTEELLMVVSKVNPRSIVAVYEPSNQAKVGQRKFKCYRDSKIATAYVSTQYWSIGKDYPNLVKF